MKTLLECYEPYSIDFYPKYYCDKNVEHSYIPYYEKLLAPFHEKQVKFLEIGAGVYGLSLMMWKDYFFNGEIHGLDIRERMPKLPPSIHYHKVNVRKRKRLNEEFAFYNVEYFDIVIDDGSHKTKDQVCALDFFFPLLKKTGIYVIEDIRLDRPLEPFKHFGSLEVVDLRSERYNPDINRNDNALLLFKKL